MLWYAIPHGKEAAKERRLDWNLAVARIGSYRSLACVSLVCPRRHEQLLRGEEPRVGAASDGQANSKHTQAAV